MNSSFYLGIFMLLLLTGHVISYVFVQSVYGEKTNTSSTVETLEKDKLGSLLYPKSFHHIVPFHPRNMTEYLQEKMLAEKLSSDTQSRILSKMTPRVPPPIVSQGFEGLGDIESCGGCTPPDVSVAAGPNHVMETVNTEAKIWTKSGIPQKQFSLQSFFISSVSHTQLPSSSAFDTSGNLWVADTFNSRILEFTSPFSNGESPTVVIGQPDFTSTEHPLTPTANSLDGPFGLTFDASGNLWVADTVNQRILEYNKGAGFTTGQAASLVIGQPDFTSRNTGVSSTALFTPFSLTFDASGNLWVADSFNHRILEYNKGAGFTTGQAASLVIGQPDFTSRNTGVSSTALYIPFSLTFDASGNLWITDDGNNRILEYNKGAGFTTGQAASLVIGQPDFTSNTILSPPDSNSLIDPRGLTFDASGNLWVADTSDGRVLKYSDGDNNPSTSNFVTHQAASLVIGQPDFTSNTTPSHPTENSLYGPRGLAFDTSGNLWVADGGNNRILEYNKGAGFTTGQAASLVIGQSSFTTFFSNADFLTDPKIIYDASSVKWFMSLFDASDNGVLLAVSDTNDPTGTWKTNFVSFGDNCPDQPILGINDDKVVISVNSFTGGCIEPFLGAEYVVLDKNSLIAGNVVSQHFGPFSTFSSLHPVQSLGATSTLFMVSTFDFNTVLLTSLTGTVPNVSIDSIALSTQPRSTPPGAVQPATAKLLDTEDNRVMDAKWYQGKLWLAFHDGCQPAGDTQNRSCVRVVEIDTASRTIIQDFDIGTAQKYYFYPALGIDNNGGVDLVFGSSSSSSYPSIVITKQTSSDPINSVEPLQTIKSGSTSYTALTDTVQRYGDYFGAAVDPSDRGSVWVAGEYINAPNNWSTFISRIFQSCVMPISGDWTITSNCALASSTTAPGNVIVQNNAVLTIPSGKSLDVDFLHHKIVVKPGSGILVKSGGTIK